MKELKIAAIFPGQGAQYVGMGKDLYENYDRAKKMFDLASDTLNLDLKEICFNGPEEELKKTDVSQAAILTISMICYEIFKEEMGENFSPFIAGGLSLGEYSALVAAGCVSFKDALFIVKERGKYMQESCEESKGGMASILGLDSEVIKEICDEVKKENYVAVANFNCPGQIVISGTQEGVKAAQQKAVEKNAKKVIPLNVSGAFHSELMATAAEKLGKVLQEKEIFFSEKMKVVTNVNGQEIKAEDNIKDILVKQVVSSVYWENCIGVMIGYGVDCFIEFGCGKVLGGLLKRIDRKANYTNVGDIESIKNSKIFLTSL